MSCLVPNQRSGRSLASLFLLSVFLSFVVPTLALAQQNRRSLERLPSVEKIVARYLKAIGGKKRVAPVKDSISEWSALVNNQPGGRARIVTKAPASSRLELLLNDGEIASGTNSSSAWAKELGEQPRTLTGPESATAKLQAVLDSAQFIDYKKKNVAARVLSGRGNASEPSFAVEFSTRSGGRLIYHFNRATGLLNEMVDEARGVSTLLSEYRDVDGLLVPHHLQIKRRGAPELSLFLTTVRRNTYPADSIFDPPPASEALDVAALLRAVSKNQDELELRFTEYSFLQKETNREINSKGEIKKEKSRVYEVFPIANRGPVMKLLSEDGVVLSGERAAKEENRVRKEFEEAEREKEKDEARAEKRRLERQRKNEDEVEISHFLRACEFVSPRRERLRDREAVVFDFRPRPGFRPKNRQEDLISKLVGVIWIDPADQQVMRLEARLAEGFKMAGGLLFSLRPGAAFAMEQTRMAEGVWLPRFAQLNLSMKVLLFGGGDINRTIEWSDYKHFSGDVHDYKLDAPSSHRLPKPGLDVR